MTQLLITQSLISSWSYMYDCFEGCEEDAYNDFLRTLRREPCEQTEAMLNGIAFENEVYKEAQGKPRTPHEKWEKGIKAVAAVLKDAPVQIPMSRVLDIGGYDLLVYGVLDALKAGVIYDVKFISKSFGSAELAGKYLNSPQHPAYLYMLPAAREFTYLVSDGEDLYTETYTRAETRPFEEIALEFLRSLEEMNLIDLYKEKWQTK